MIEPVTNPSLPTACPQCGTPVSAAALDGLCPACLLRQATMGGAITSPFQPPSVADMARLFPQLEIIEFIGKGGMGAVYKARQPALDRFVALKILPSQATEGSGFAERFNREARALARLNHPNIVAIHEFGQVSGLLFFVMEYVDGTNLRQLEQSERLLPLEALQIVPQICEALQYAHEAGIVHRDIKPENILLDKKGRVKIADFGIAKIVGRQEPGVSITETKQAIGTPHYMAPEQLEKPQTVDHRADIYSLGVVFYEMLTGELPLGKFAPPSCRVHVDVRLDEVVLRALEKQPEQRYQHVSEVKTDLEKVTSTSVQVEAARAGISAQPKGRKAVWAGLLIILILLAPGLMFLRSIKGKRHLGNSDVAPSTARKGVSEIWHTTQIATLDKKTGILATTLPDVGLVEFLAVCRISTNDMPTDGNQICIPTRTNDIWRGDGTPMDNIPADFGNLKGFQGFDSTEIGGAYAGEVNSVQYRSLLFRVANSDFTRLEFERNAAHLFSRHSARGLELATLIVPISARAVKMRLGCPVRSAWLPISTVDVNGKVYNRPPRPPRDGIPDFKPDWTVSLSVDGSASVKLLLNVDHQYCDVETSAVDTNGIAHRDNGIQAIQTGKTAIYALYFAKPENGAFKEFRAEVRPIQWVEFPNIALQPNATVSDTIPK
jgi:serine/threonine protein kinase